MMLLKVIIICLLTVDNIENNLRFNIQEKIKVKV